MVRTAVLGASGFAGQETLDRVLAHPGLELRRARLRLARRPSGRGARPAALAERARPLPRSSRTTRRSRPGPSSSSAASTTSSSARRRRRRRRSLRVAPLRDADPGRLRAPPELAPPRAGLIANPGCYATAALLALVPIAGIVDPASVVVDGKSGISGAGRALKESSHAAAVLDNITPYARRRAQARARDRAAPRLPGHVRAARRPAPPRASSAPAT